MTWADYTVLVFGLSGLALANTARFQRYACIPGMLGQIGWFGSLTYTAQPGPFLVCVAYSAVWMWAFWRFWIQCWLNTAMTPTADPTGGPASFKARAAALSNKGKPRLKRVK